VIRSGKRAWGTHVNNLDWKNLAGPIGVLLASIITQLVTIGILFANQAALDGGFRLGARGGIGNLPLALVAAYLQPLRSPCVAARL
jgi:hypothetical protein